MPDVDNGRVQRLISELREALSLLNEALERPREAFLSSWRDRLSVRYLIVEIVEASTSLGIHLLEAEGGRAPETYGEVFNKMAERDIISWEVAEGMRKLVGLRNLVVHRYWEVDDGRIYDEGRGSGLEVIRRFIEEVEAYLASRRA